MQLMINIPQKKENILDDIIHFLEKYKKDGVEIVNKIISTQKSRINENDLKDLQIDSMSKTWDNKEDNIWDELY